MEKVKQRILNILDSSGNKNASEENIKDLFGKLKLYLDKINRNSIKLYTLFNSVNISSALANPKTEKELTPFDNFLELNLPLYLVHFLKQCEEKNLIQSNYVVLNSFENLEKENEYQKKRGCNQIILMWKELYPNRFKILSFVSSNFSEFDFEEKKYFISRVGGSSKEEINESWKKYNSINILDLISDTELISLEDGIKQMIK